MTYKTSNARSLTVRPLVGKMLALIGMSLVCLGADAMNAIAVTPPSSVTPASKVETIMDKANEKNNEKNNEKFSQHKALTLEVMAQRQKILNQEKSCVIDAANSEAMKKCWQQARDNRQEMGKELKAKVAK